MFSFLGPILGAATSIFGNIAGRNDAKDQNAANMAWSQQQWNENRDLQREFWDKNYGMQKEFAQSGIRWRMEDAKAAGIHPLFALSGGGAAASPTAYVPHTSDPSTQNSGEYLSRMGQDIGRAISATQTMGERTSDKLTALSLERAGLENELLKAQIAKTTGQIGPPMPSLSKSSNAVGGAERYGSWDAEPHAVTTAFPGSPSSAAGDARPYMQWNRSSTGLLASPVKDSNVEVDELTSPLGAEFVFNTRLAPYFGYKGGNHPPLELMQKHFGPNVIGSKFVNGEFQPVYSNKPADSTYWEKLNKGWSTARSQLLNPLRITKDRGPSSWAPRFTIK